MAICAADEGDKEGNRMGLACTVIGHKWDGCTCRRCGAVRDEAHDWNSCTCRKCGKVRDAEQYHSYWIKKEVRGAPEHYRIIGQSCTCSVCHKIRDTHHRYRNGRCECHEYVQTSSSGGGSIADVYSCKYCGDTKIYFTD